jgi:hypothetical protein
MALQKQFKGIWVVADPVRKPDFVLYYAHGEELRVCTDGR